MTAPRTGSRKADTPAPSTSAGDGDGSTPPPSTSRKRSGDLPLRTLRRIGRVNTLWTFGVLVLLCIGFTVAAPGAFASLFNLVNVLTTSATLILLGIGMTFVIVSAGIDLSVGSVLVFSSIVAVKVMVWLAPGQPVQAGWGVVIAGSAAGIASGAAWGVFNGVLVAKGRLPALIVTLGSFGMALGLAQVLTNGVDISTVPTVLTTTVGHGTVLGVPWIVIIVAGIAIVAGLVLALTRFGRYTYAIGSGAEAARRVGINVDRHLIKVYGLAGLLSGVAGVLSLAHFNGTTIASHITDNLSAIAGVVLGGASLFGGVGTIAGSVIGLLIPAVLRDGFVIIGVQPFWQRVAVGAVLVLAVYFDQLRRRARERE